MSRHTGGDQGSPDRDTTRDGKAREVKRKAGQTFVNAPVAAHVFENLASTDCKHLHIEAK